MVSLLSVGLIEALRTDLEAEVLHCLVNVVVALEQGQVEVAECVITLLVVHIHKGCYLRELVSYVLQQAVCTLLVALLVIMELDENHPLSGVGVANHYVAQQTVLLSEVEECHACGEGIVAYGVANLVVQVVHQPALLDGQNLVEGSGDVKSDAVHIVERSALGYLLACQPALVAAAELQLVAIFLGMHRSHDGAELWQFYLANACQLVVHLLLLGFELLLVGQVLPLASSADTEMLAHRLFAYFTLLDESYNLRLAVAVLLLAHLQVHYVARHSERNEDHHVVNMRQRFAFSSHRFNGHVLKYR